MADIERRRHKRFALSGKIPGEIELQGGNKPTFVPVDISKYGLGVLFDRSLGLGTELSLCLHAPQQLELKFRVQWEANVDSLPQKMVRCGLHLMDEKVDLTQLLQNCETLLIEDLS